MDPIYLDYNATYPSPVGHLERVVKRIEGFDYNPSAPHAFGRKARRLLDECRASLAKNLVCEPEELFFCSGATEANNLAVKHLVESGKSRVVVSAAEHPSVHEAALQVYGEANVGFASLSADGTITKQQSDWEELLGKDVGGVCLIHVHNESGQVSDLVGISKTIKSIRPDILIHVDMVQALGKMPINFQKLPCVDTASFSGHKIGAVKGVGFLYAKQGSQLSKVFYGGGQENGVRPGTENLFGIVSIAQRLEEMDARVWKSQVEPLYLQIRTLVESLPGSKVIGQKEANLGNTIYFYLNGRTVQEILLRLEMQGLCASSGSACSSGLAKPSRVGLAMGMGMEQAKHLVRISLGPELAESTEEILAKLRKALCE